MTIAGILVLVGVVAGIVPSVASQATTIGQKAAEGIVKAKHWLQGPPLNIGDDQISSTPTPAGQDQGQRRLDRPRCGQRREHGDVDGDDGLHRPHPVVLLPSGR